MNGVESDKQAACQPKKNVVFLKTHKTGSSTVTNILNRYCDTNDLTMALPRDGMFNFFWPLPFEGNFVDQRTERTVNMLSNHARYSDVMANYMPSDTKFITILRDPVTQFESLFSYMSFSSFLGLSYQRSPINAFLENPWKYLSNVTSSNPDIILQHPYINLLKSGQFFDLGLNGEDFNNIQKAIYKLEKDFHLILIMEYFDESMILLTRELCWTVKDVLYFKQNQRRFNDKTKVSKLSKISKFNLLEWNKADFMLYNYFNETFWRKINKQDVTFWKEVKMLRENNKAMSDVCLVPGEHEGKVYENQSKTVKGFKIKPNLLSYKLREDCKRMTTSEINYIKYFRRKYTNM